jgi:hypothetical protein
VYAERLFELLGPDACRELLDVLQRPDSERASPIGRLNQREDAGGLAELPIEIEFDPDDITQLGLIAALKELIQGLPVL